jgi:hypothetical protein
MICFIIYFIYFIWVVVVSIILFCYWEFSYIYTLCISYEGEMNVTSVVRQSTTNSKGFFFLFSFSLLFFLLGLHPLAAQKVRNLPVERKETLPHLYGVAT